MSLRQRLLPQRDLGHAVADALHEVPDRLSRAEALELVCTATGWPVGHAWVRLEGNWRSADDWCALDEDRYQALHDVTAACNLGPGRGVIAAVLHLETTRFLPDVRGLGSDQRCQVAEAAGLHGVVGVPVSDGREVVAVLEFLTSEPIDADDQLCDALRAVADRIVAAPEPAYASVPQQARAAG